MLRLSYWVRFSIDCVTVRRVLVRLTLDLLPFSRQWQSKFIAPLDNQKGE